MGMGSRVARSIGLALPQNATTRGSGHATVFDTPRALMADASNDLPVGEARAAGTNQGADNGGSQSAGVAFVKRKRRSTMRKARRRKRDPSPDASSEVSVALPSRCRGGWSTTLPVIATRTHRSIARVAFLNRTLIELLMSGVPQDEVEAARLKKRLTKRSGGGSGAGGAGGDGSGPPVPKIGAVASTRAAAPATYSGGATAASEIDTQQDRDARALAEKAVEATAAAARSGMGGGEAAAGSGASSARGATSSDADAAGKEKKLYRGKAGYRDYTGRSAETISKGKVSGTMGPVRAPTNIRNTSFFDYAPDICKDYKETGTCGYGDSCIFLHDRGDYKQGWQIERDWEIDQKKKREALAGVGDADAGAGSDEDAYVVESDDDELPFACHICRKPFTAPVVTRCGHYFCRGCAISRVTSGASACAVCGKQTGGTFKPARALEPRLRDAGGDEASGAVESAAGPTDSVSTPTLSGAGKDAAAPENRKAGWSRVSR